jgi:NitT/TauT family transport system permease protein
MVGFLQHARIQPELLKELRVKPPRAVRWALGASAIGIVLLLWWLATLGAEPESRLLSPVVLPSPGEVLGSVHALVTERALLQSIAATLERVVLGFALATLVGVPLGILAGSWRGIDAFMAPISLFGRNIPIAALIPLTVVWFGIGETQKIMFIFVACVPFVFGSAAQAVVDVEDRYVETARTLGASRWQTVCKVLVPLALPSIFNSQRILFGLAFGYIMLAELIDAKHGLGYLISTSQRRGLNEHIYLILVVIGLIAYGIDRLLFLLQQRLFAYRTDGEG